MVVCVGEAEAVGPIHWKLVMWEYELEGGRAEGDFGIFEKENPTQAWCEILGITAGQVDQTGQQ